MPECPYCGMHHFNHLIVVLFDVRVSPTRYQEWYEGLKKTYPNVVVVRKDFTGGSFA